MQGEHGAGKGDTYRRVDMEKYRKNYDAIFRKKKKKRKNCPSEKDRFPKN